MQKYLLVLMSLFLFLKTTEAASLNKLYKAYYSLKANGANELAKKQSQTYLNENNLKIQSTKLIYGPDGVILQNGFDYDRLKIRIVDAENAVHEVNCILTSNIQSLQIQFQATADCKSQTLKADEFNSRVLDE
jgi:hypothetical protein